MRLRRLILHNYRSYADLDLPFDFDAACVLGPTGSGKSAIVDATLWALFGRTRSRGDGFMRLGADHTNVTVEFDIGGGSWRVFRSRSTKTKVSKSDLSLSVRNGGNWLPVGGKGIDATQVEINRVIGMDYDTLLCSAISRQDEADRFTRPPKLSIDGKTYEGSAARIQVLAQSLGLQAWEERRKKAALLVGEIEKQVTILDTKIMVLKEKAGGETAANDAVRRAQEEIGAAQQKIELEENLLVGLTAEVERLAASCAGTEEKIKGFRPIAERAKEAGEQTEGLRFTLFRLAKITAKADEIREKSGQSAALSLEAGALERKAQDARNELREIDQRVKSREEARNREIRQLEKEHARLSAEIPALRKGREQKRGELERLLQRLSQSADTINKVPCQGMERLPDTCPLLESARQAEDQIAQTTFLIEETKQPSEMEVTAESELHKIGLDLGVYERMEDESGRYKGLIAKQVIKRADVALSEEAVRAVQERIEDLSPWVALVPDLAGAEEAEKAAREKLTAATVDIATWKLAQEEVLGLRKDLDGGKETLASKRIILEAGKRNVVRFQGELDAHRIAFGSAQERLKSCQEAKAEVGVREAAVAGQREEARIHALLVEAYRAIPLMVLENVAIPFLEHEANAILARTSPSGMRVSLPTQRALKSREGLADGLEIVVRDRVGERSLDDFSGGQGFLVALALRVALAKLQARRADTEIATLIIDEGFGSVDADGTLPEVMAALREVASDFGLLLAITHVKEMANVFPVRLEVSGGPERSVVEVIR